MRIPRVHVEQELAVGTEIVLAQAQSHYLKHVLRLKPGAALLLFNGREARDYPSVLLADGKQLIARIDDEQAVDTEPGIACEIIQGLGRSDHMDWVIQKTTELGARRILLFNAERSQRPPKPAQLKKKMQHWRGVAVSACEQSGRGIIPGINFEQDMKAAIDACTADTRLLLDFAGAAPADALPRATASVAILLGPEGGLTPAEIELAGSRGFSLLRLGPRVLRTETAATAALAIVQSLVGDIG